jgi:hypothetical protein
MKNVDWYWTVSVVLVGFLAWDNWQVRNELEQLRQSETLLSDVGPPVSAPPKACPVTPQCPAAQWITPAIKGAESAPNQNTSAVQIPPGTDLLEAIKMIQREQAKSQPGSAGINPFGAPQTPQ